MGPSNLEICKMKLEQLFFNFFKNFKQNPKNVGYKRQNQIKTRFSMPKGAKGNLLPQFLEKKKHLKGFFPQRIFGPPQAENFFGYIVKFRRSTKSNDPLSFDPPPPPQ